MAAVAAEIIAPRTIAERQSQKSTIASAISYGLEPVKRNMTNKATAPTIRTILCRMFMAFLFSLDVP